jgi:hypothetical protein
MGGIDMETLRSVGALEWGDVEAMTAEGRREASGERGAGGALGIEKEDASVCVSYF